MRKLLRRSKSRRIIFKKFLSKRDVIPYSATPQGKELFPRGEWNLYKIQWKTDKKTPKMFAELTVPVSGNVTTILYNKKANSIQDPFGWNQNCDLDESTKKLLQRALEISSRVI
jgi:hypothetical protein